VLENTEDRRQIKNTDNTQTKHNQGKAKNSKPNYHGLVAFYDTRLENDLDLFYNTPEPTRAAAIVF